MCWQRDSKSLQEQVMFVMLQGNTLGCGGMEMGHVDTSMQCN
jgi:hypothetical protein